MSSGISCTICSELYKSVDDIYATECGHAFHYHCLQGWQARSSNCAFCACYNRKTFKLFLNFEAAAVPPPQPEQPIDEELEQVEIDQSVLQLELDNNLRIQEALKAELNRSINETSVLQAKLLEQQEMQLKLAEKLSENDLHVEVVHGYVHTLAQQRDERDDELNRLAEEKQRLERELQRMGEREMPERRNSQAQRGRKAAEMIVLKGLPKRLAHTDWKDMLVSLAHRLGINVPRGDIQDIYQLGGRNNFDENGRMGLVVKFNMPGYKEDFLRRNEKLATLPDYMDWSIEEFKRDLDQDLFDYAKILRRKGFKAVYRRRGQVVAKRADGERPIIIRNKEHVDSLKKGGD